jgi:predicted RNA binding protein YcfA (HicA-like mRNA interferase family)
MIIAAMKARKILKKILSGSKNVRFDELIALAAAFGFELRRIRGSHHNLKHPKVPDLLSLQPDKNGKAKPYQAKQLLELAEEYNLTLADEDEEGNE